MTPIRSFTHLAHALLVTPLVACVPAPATGPGPSSPNPASPERDTDIKARFAAELDCSASSMDELRGWCPVSRLDEQAFAPPETATTLFGISQPIRPGAKIRDTLLGAGLSFRISTLTLDGEHAGIRDVIPENPQEHQVLLDVASRIVDELDHHRGALPVGAELVQFASAQQAAAAGGKPFTRDGNAARFVAKTPTTLYLVGDAYVAIEHPSDGLWVSIYPRATPRDR
jgi:hypothetical protein